MSSIAVPGNPLVLYTNGIPIGAGDLDFGNGVSQAQLNALSSFSQMANAIPSPGSVWVPTGTETWTIYNLVLSMSEFAQPSGTAVVDESFATKVPTDAVFVPQPSRSGTPGNTGRGDDVGSLLSALHHSTRGSLLAAGFRFVEPTGVDRMTSAVTPAAAVVAPAPATVEPSPLASTGLASEFQSLKAQLDIDALTDTRGATFYPTYLYPADFYDPAYDASWKPFEITPGQDDPWAPLDTGGPVKGEMITVALQRSWWSTWVFASRGWRFSSTSGMTALSDGGSPPQGMMPLYASLMIVVRNLQAVGGTADSISTRPASALFTLRGDAGSSAPKPSPADAAVSTSSMTIIGFGCTAVPRSPNPDPSLNWGP